MSFHFSKRTLWLSAASQRIPARLDSKSSATRIATQRVSNISIAINLNHADPIPIQRYLDLAA